MNGEFTTYGEDGSKIKKTVYENDEKNGKEFEYYTSGNKKSMVQYSYGKIIGEPKEGVTLKALSNSLSDEDGIASISISWETSKDGRNWIVLNSLSGPVLPLTQALVGSQVRARVAVVDNFGIETNLYSQATRTVENVNNKPSGRIVIRRVGQ